MPLGRGRSEWILQIRSASVQQRPCATFKSSAQARPGREKAASGACQQMLEDGETRIP
jgi:hypothetical protein